MVRRDKAFEQIAHFLVSRHPKGPLLCHEPRLPEPEMTEKRSNFQNTWHFVHGMSALLPRRVQCRTNCRRFIIKEVSKSDNKTLVNRQFLQASPAVARISSANRVVYSTCSMMAWSGLHECVGGG